MSDDVKNAEYYDEIWYNKPSREPSAVQNADDLFDYGGKNNAACLAGLTGGKINQEMVCIKRVGDDPLNPEDGSVFATENGILKQVDGELVPFLSSREYHPSIAIDQSKKLMKKISDNSYQLIIPKENGHYIRLDLENNSTTTTDSLAGTTSDLTSWRVRRNYFCQDACVGNIVLASSSGSWLTNGLTDFVDYVEPNNPDWYSYRYSNDIGAWVEINADTDSQGKLTISFRGTTGSSGNVDISIDGVVVDAGVVLTRSATSLVTLEYETTVGSHVVRVENKDAGASFISIIGINWAFLKDSKAGLSYDTVGYYIDSSKSDYCLSPSANNYAIYDKDANLWGGSYHGGETGITTDIVADGISLALSNDEMVVAENLSVEQEFTIDWSGSGGGSFDCYTKHDFTLGGWAFRSSFTGDVNATFFYSGMYGADPAFENLLIPEKVDISTIADGDYYNIKDTGNVLYKNDTGQQVSVNYTQYDGASAFNKDWVVRVRKSLPSYYKFYTGPVINKLANVTNVTATTVLKFL